MVREAFLWWQREGHKDTPTPALWRYSCSIRECRGELVYVEGSDRMLRCTVCGLEEQMPLFIVAAYEQHLRKAQDLAAHSHLDVGNVVRYDDEVWVVASIPDPGRLSLVNLREAGWRVFPDNVYPRGKIDKVAETVAAYIAASIPGLFE